METYFVTVEYMRKNGSRHTRDFEIEAESLSKADNLARSAFNGDFRHRSSTIVQVTTRPLMPRPGFAQARVSAGVENLSQAPKREFHVGCTYKLRSWLGKVILQSRFITAAGKDTVVLEREADAKVHTMGYRQFEELATPRQRVEYWSVYPPLKGEQHGRTFKSTTGPVYNSMYGVENLVQIKVTFLGDEIVGKEIIDV